MGTLTQTTAELQLAVDQSEAMAITGLSGFNRLDTSTMGTIQFCYSASSGEVHQIDKDGAYTKLTSQTTFADGSTAIADRTIAVYHSAGETEFSYYYQGTLVTDTGIQTLQMTDDGGGYVYLDSDGSLAQGGSAFALIVQKTLIAYVGWNTTEDELTWFADERHGINMNPVTHLYNHSVIGFAWAKSGSDITGLANNVTTFTAVTAGVWADEDIELMIAEQTTVPMAWKEGADGQWRFSAASNVLLYKPAASYVWNNEDSGGAGVWGLDAVTSANRWLVQTFWASNNVLAPVFQTVSQLEPDSRGDARDRVESAVHKIQTDGFPAPEMSPIGSVIMKSDGTLEIGADGEIWIDHRFGAPNSRF